jgi:hypothetical protein
MYASVCQAVLRELAQFHIVNTSILKYECPLIAGNITSAASTDRGRHDLNTTMPTVD